MPRAALALLPGLLVCGAAAAQSPDEVPLEDLLEIVRLPGKLLAIDASGGGQTRVDLELGEQVRWLGTRGEIGIALTDRRLLAVARRSAAWQEDRYWRNEAPPSEALLGDRVALVQTSQRVIGFTGAGHLIEYRVGPQEQVVATRIGANAAVFLTNRTAQGLSAQLGGFFETAIHARERLESVSPRTNLVTVRTDRRLLIFRSPTGTWEERKLELR